MLAVLDFAAMFGNVLTFLYLALGLGLVIFFHELGHFAVAKWCGVHVDRFSIGFGPILWSRQKGETEYALSAIPFGGYVKMLGQDDMDPGQMADEDIAANPRSYSAKSVWQRMAIISAGVIMNVITGMLFFAAAFGLGVSSAPPVLGYVVPGAPAWMLGLEQGDRVTHINDEKINDFMDLRMAVTLSSGDVRVRGLRVDGSKFDVTMTPEKGSVRTIGVLPTKSLQLRVPLKEGDPVLTAGLSASMAEPALLPGDVILGIDGQTVGTYAELKQILLERRADPVEFDLRRQDGTTVKTTLKPTMMRHLGFRMDIGPVSGVRAGSPAATAGMLAGDKITTVDGQVVGKDLDPLELPDYWAARAGESEPVVVVVRREQESGRDQEVTLELKPENRPGWGVPPLALEVPLDAPAIGIAYTVMPYVAHVDKGSDAEKNGLKPGQKIIKVEFREVVAEGEKASTNITVDLEPDDDSFKGPANWAHAFWEAQMLPDRSLKLHVREGDEKPFVCTVAATERSTMNMPVRGFLTDDLQETQQASGIGDALAMGTTRARKTILQIYMTLRALIRQDVSSEELHGPLGIAHVGYKVASQGISPLLVFLGFLSINLAVLNFLPIPILDGGHMVFLIWEAVTGRKPSQTVLVLAQYVGLAFILGLMVYVLYLDLFVHMFGD